MLGGTAVYEENKNVNGIFSKDYCKALDNCNTVIYIIEPESYKILYCNKTLRDYFDEDFTGQPCYKALMGKDAPCEFCAATKLYKYGDSTPVESYNPIKKAYGIMHSAKLNINGRELIQITCVDITRQKQLHEELRYRNKEYDALVNRSLSGVIRYDIANDIATVNVDKNLNPVPEYEIKDYLKVLFDSDITKFIEPEDIAASKSVFEDIKKGVPSKGRDYRLRLPGGTRWFHIDYALINDDDGKPFRALVFFSDSTEQKEKEIAFKEWNARLDKIMDEYTAFMEVNISDNIIEAEARNGSWDKVTSGRRFTDFVEEMSSIGIFTKDVAAFRSFFNRERLLGQFYAGNKESSLEYRAVVKGLPIWHKAEVQMVMAPNSNKVKASIVYINVDDEVREKKRLVYKAQTDAMTGLYNHATFEHLIKNALGENTGDNCAFLIIDLDDLRTINSVMGHPEGDKALKGIANTMMEYFGEDCVLGRIGGDEFVALLKNIPDSETLNIEISGFMKKIGEIKIGHANISPIYVSVGAAMGTVGKTDFKTLYEQADLALYYTKANGKNNFTVYTPDLKNREFTYKPHEGATLTTMDIYDNSDFQKLLKAMSTFFPLVISANLTKNTFAMLEYANYASQRAQQGGNYDELILDGASAFYPEDREEFLKCFKRENMLKAYAEGRKTVEHAGRQLGDDGVYRMVQTVAIFVDDDENGDVCEISMTHVIG